jgi:hypothetical protein
VRWGLTEGPCHFAGPWGGQAPPSHHRPSLAQGVGDAAAVLDRVQRLEASSSTPLGRRAAPRPRRRARVLLGAGREAPRGEKSRLGQALVSRAHACPPICPGRLFSGTPIFAGITMNAKFKLGGAQARRRRVSRHCRLGLYEPPPGRSAMSSRSTRRFRGSVGVSARTTHRARRSPTQGSVVVITNACAIASPFGFSLHHRLRLLRPRRSRGGRAVRAGRSIAISTGSNTPRMV